MVAMASCSSGKRHTRNVGGNKGWDGRGGRWWMGALLKPTFAEHTSINHIFITFIEYWMSYATNALYIRLVITLPYFHGDLVWCFSISQLLYTFAPIVTHWPRIPSRDLYVMDTIAFITISSQVLNREKTVLKLVHPLGINLLKFCNSWTPGQIFSISAPIVETAPLLLTLTWFILGRKYNRHKGNMDFIVWKCLLSTMQ